MNFTGFVRGFQYNHSCVAVLCVSRCVPRGSAILWSHFFLIFFSVTNFKSPLATGLHVYSP